MRTFRVLAALGFVVALAATSLRATPCLAQCNDAQFFVPYTADWTGTLTVTTDVHRVFRPGERVDLCWTESGTRGLVNAWLFLDGDDARLPIGTGSGCLVLPMVMPYASTDSARFALSLTYGDRLDRLG